MVLRLGVWLALAALTAAGAGAAEAPWELADTVRHALDHHPSLAEARQKADAAAARQEAARAEWRPLVGLQSTATRQGPDVSLNLPFTSVEMVPDSRYDARVWLEYTLLDGGGRQARVAQASASAGLAGAGERIQRERVALEAALAHIAVLRARAHLQVAREARQRLEAHRQVAAARYEAGAVPKLDLIRAEADLAAAHADEAAAESSLAVAETQFNRATGRPLSEPVILADLPAGPPDPLPAEETGVSLALDRRPEFAALNAQRALAQAQEREAQAEQRTRVRVSGNVVQQTETPLAKERSWSLGLILSRPVWDGGRSRAMAESARAGVAAVDAGLESVRQEVQAAVRQVLLEDAGARARLHSADEAVRAAEEGVRVARIAYEAGLRTSVDVTDAQVALTRARARQVDARYDLALARIRWAFAVGSASDLGGGEKR